MIAFTILVKWFSFRKIPPPLKKRVTVHDFTNTKSYMNLLEQGKWLFLYGISREGCLEFCQGNHTFWYQWKKCPFFRLPMIQSILVAYENLTTFVSYIWSLSYWRYKGELGLWKVFCLLSNCMSIQGSHLLYGAFSVFILVYSYAAVAV